MCHSSISDLQWSVSTWLSVVVGGFSVVLSRAGRLNILVLHSNNRPWMQIGPNRNDGIHTSAFNRVAGAL